MRSAGRAMLLAASLAACNALVGLQDPESSGAGGAGGANAASASSDEVTASGHVTSGFATVTASTGVSPDASSVGSGGHGPSDAAASATVGAGGAGGAAQASAEAPSASTAGGSMSSPAASSSTGADVCGPGSTGSISDDFSQFPGNLWSFDNGLTYVGGGGQVEIQVNPGDHAESQAQTGDQYSLFGCKLSLELVQAPSESGDNAFFAFGDSTHSIAFYVAGSSVEALDTGTLVGELATFGSNAKRLRFRDDGGTMHFELSYDDQNWTEVASEASPGWLDKGFVSFGVEADGTAGATDTIIFDNLNL